MEEGNQLLISGLKLNLDTMQLLTQTGKVKLAIPQKAEYFRVLVWTNENEQPDLHTNWVEIIPSKTYTLEADHLVPSVLMSGMGG